jgi:hypothetical protein
MRNSESDLHTVFWLELDPDELLKVESKLPKLNPTRVTEEEPDVGMVVLAVMYLR